MKKRFLLLVLLSAYSLQAMDSGDGSGSSENWWSCSDGEETSADPHNLAQKITALRQQKDKNHITLVAALEQRQTQLKKCNITLDSLVAKHKKTPRKSTLIASTRKRKHKKKKKKTEIVETAPDTTDTNKLRDTGTKKKKRKRKSKQGDA